jgi:hypothetical protein
MGDLPSSSLLDRLKEETTKKAAIAITAIIKILHRFLNIRSFERCLRCWRWRIVPVGQRELACEIFERLPTRGGSWVIEGRAKIYAASQYGR